MEIEVGKIGDCIVKFAVWVDLTRAIKILTGQEGNLAPAVRQACGNCHVVMGPNQEQLLRNRVKFEGLIVWTPVGDDSLEATDKVRIARFISELPSRVLVEEFTTLDQVYRWMEWKDKCIWIAKCFLAGHKHLDNPLLRELEEGTIDKYYHDNVWLTVDLYENLWKLIHLKGKLVKAAFLKQGWDYPFKCSRELLEEIISSFIDGEFSNVLKSHYVEHAGEFRKIATLGRKNNKDFLSTQERQRLTELTKKHSQPNVWLERLLAVGNALAEWDSFVQVRMNIHQEIMDGIAAFQVVANFKPELKKHGQTSYTWQNGVKVSGTKPGWKA